MPFVHRGRPSGVGRSMPVCRCREGVRWQRLVAIEQCYRCRRFQSFAVHPCAVISCSWPCCRRTCSPPWRKRRRRHRRKHHQRPKLFRKCPSCRLAWWRPPTRPSSAASCSTTACACCWCRTPSSTSRPRRWRCRSGRSTIRAIPRAWRISWSTCCFWALKSTPKKASTAASSAKTAARKTPTPPATTPTTTSTCGTRRWPVRSIASRSFSSHPPLRASSCCARSVRCTTRRCAMCKTTSAALSR
jgi:hypothetical protein